MAAQSPPSPLKNAFDGLKKSVSSSDAAVFQDTSLEDVWKAAEEIQAAQRQRKSLRNMRRIEPFLKALDKYSKAIEILCQGTPYLPWIWAPIKLMLQLASEYTDIFDKLIDAYAQIAEAMPQFDRLQKTFKDDTNFRVVLAMIYSDILEFHGRAYKFFRRRAWHIFFDSLWKDFQSRFHGILKNLAQHKELLIREVITIDVIEARSWRARFQENLAVEDKKRRDFYLHDTIAWLKIADERQDDELDRLLRRKHEGTCEWIFNHAFFKAWKDDAHGEPVLWLKGIPGAGKTILSTYIIRRLQGEPITTAYHICNSYTIGKSMLGELMRSLTLQLLRANLELAPYIFENYANRGLAPSIMHLRRLLPELFATIPSVRICIDGLDEYPEPDQRAIIQELLSFLKSSNGHCRILFSSREGTQIDRAMRGKPTISLKDEYTDVGKDIEKYVHGNLEVFNEKFPAHLIKNIQDRMVSKANGMFLWVRLVMLSLEQCHSVRELQIAVDRLPDGLDQAYGRILDRVMNDLGSQNSAKAVRILEWIACSFRTMKEYEIQDGIVFYGAETILDDNTKLTSGFLDLCKPLIEQGPNSTIDFVHYSAKEYILHLASGPFLQYHQAHYDIAFSCITYLNTSFCFNDPKYSETELKIRVLKGFHGLHHYANEFWFQHLLQYAKCDVAIDDDYLDEPLQDIQLLWKQEPGLAANSLKLEDTTSADSIKHHLEALDDTPEYQAMGLDILTFRTFLAQEKYAHLESDDLKDHQLKYDPTYLSEISQRYQSIVKLLIDSTPHELPAEVNHEWLENFKRIYVGSAFICRYRECPRYSDGFSSLMERDEHERQHAKPLRCADPSCHFFSRGFTSRTGLLKHNRKYHPKPDEVEIPEFEPRREPSPPDVLPPAPPPRAATPPPLTQAPPAQPPPVPRQAWLEKPPKQPRISRAKKGLPVHDCNICHKTFTRAEGMRRHRLSHEKPQYHCTFEECERAFHRPDLLTRHLSRHWKDNEMLNTAISQIQGAEAGPSQASTSDTAPPPIFSVQSLLNDE